MFKRILVPVKATGGSEKAIQVACDFANQLGAEVHVLTVNIEGEEDTLAREMRDKFIGICRIRTVEAAFRTLSVKSAQDVAKTIADVSADYDLIIMGHCRYKKIYRFLHSSVAEDVMQLASCPVVVAATDCPEKHA